MNINKKSSQNLGMRHSLVIASALVATTMLLTLALGSFTQLASAAAPVAVAGKIIILPWDGTEGKVVLLPPVYSGIGTTIPLAPALVGPTLTSV